MTNLSELAARIEAAEESEQRALLIQAFDLLQPGIEKPDWLQSAARFYQMLDAEAYESAALMLVPEGWHWNVDVWPDEAGAAMHPVGAAHRWRMRRAATPALAICAAALRAKEVSDHG